MSCFPLTRAELRSFHHFLRFRRWLMSDVRLVVRNVSQNQMGLSICEEAVDVIEEIASVVIEKKTGRLNAEILRLKQTIVDLEQKQVKRCLVCMDKSAEFFWSSCMNVSSSQVAHLSVCEDCAKLISREPEEAQNCPVCRASEGSWIRAI